MLNIDKHINELVRKYNGIYRRYSDDFIIVLPAQDDTCSCIERIIVNFSEYKKQKLLELQPDKTQVFKLNKGNIYNIGHEFNPKLNEKKKNINFLGFTYDGRKVSIRQKTISKYYYRMCHKVIGIAHHYTENRGFKDIDKLYRLYSERGKSGKGNFLTYVYRVKIEFPNDLIDRPIIICLGFVKF